MIASFEEGLISVAAVAAAAAIGWSVTAPRAPVTAPPAAIAVNEPAVEDIVQAIATAEGYFAAGDHDGHSLPYLLNNPGSLKKPALNADALPTWKDTGLIVFPTPETGWAALRYQVRRMVSGDSQVYQPSDTLLHVAQKYADGDTNWGRHVAATLGVSPHATLADLAPADSSSPSK